MLLLENNRDKIHCSYLCENINAIPLLEEIKDIDWFFFYHRPHCGEMAYTSDCTKLDLSQLCRNPNEIPFLENLHLSELDCVSILSNSNALHLLEQNQDKIDWYNLSRNPGISLV